MKTRPMVIVMVAALLMTSTAAAVPSAPPKDAWTRQFGTPLHDGAFDGAADKSGSYVAGSTSGTIPGQSSAGDADAFVRRYSAAGKVLWTRQFGTPAADTAQAIAVTSDAVYVVGQTAGTLRGASSGLYDAFVRRYSLDGSVVWTRQLGTAENDGATAVSVTDDAVVIAGFAGAALPGQSSGGGTDVFVRVYDPAGRVQWTHQFGSDDSDHAAGLVATPKSLVVSAAVGGTLPGQMSAGGTDLALRRYDMQGNIVWTRQFGTNMSEFGGALARAGSSLYIGGLTEGSLTAEPNAGFYDGFLRQYSMSGQAGWTRMIATPDYDEIFDVEATSAGVYTSGSTSGALGSTPNRGALDVMIARYTHGGARVWQRQFGTSGADYGYGIAASKSGVYSAGETRAALEGQIHAGSGDVYLRRYVSYRPDGLISKTAASGYVGNDVYNTTGAGQSSLARVQRGTSQAFYLRAANDGDAADTFTVKGCASSNRFKVIYRHGANTVTNDVVDGTYKIKGVAPGSHATIRVIVKVESVAPVGATRTCAVTLTSTAKATLSDVVKATVEAKA